MAPKKKKRRKIYVSILDLPIEKLTGWQEVSMDIDKIRAAFAATLLERREKQDVAPTNRKKKKYSKILRGWQEVPMDINKINASFEMTQKE